MCQNKNNSTHVRFSVTIHLQWIWKIRGVFVCLRLGDDLFQPIFNSISECETNLWKLWLWNAWQKKKNHSCARFYNLIPGHTLCDQVTLFIGVGQDIFQPWYHPHHMWLLATPWLMQNHTTHLHCLANHWTANLETGHINYNNTIIQPWYWFKFCDRSIRNFCLG